MQGLIFEPCTPQKKKKTSVIVMNGSKQKKSLRITPSDYKYKQKFIF